MAKYMSLKYTEPIFNFCLLESYSYYPNKIPTRLWKTEQNFKENKTSLLHISVQVLWTSNIHHFLNSSDVNICTCIYFQAMWIFLA